MQLAVVRPGRVGYTRALAWQESLVEQRVRGGDDTLLLLEHDPVYTLGRGADPVFLGTASSGDVPVVRSSRGGQVTYHGPGQLVGYPIVHLREHRLDVRWYVRQLEVMLLGVLDVHGLAGRRMEGAPGIWIGEHKIASIGIAIRRWVTWHGFALNVGADLDAFDRITPCGLAGVRMTSLAREGVTATLDEVSRVVVEQFALTFGYERWSAGRGIVPSTSLEAAP